MLLILQQNMLLGDAPTLVAVPDVVGQSQASATSELEGVLFVVAVATAHSSIVAAGNVISQSPLAGVDAVEGSTVTITVSLGEAQSDASGGFFFGFDHAKAKREKRRKEIARMKAEQEAIDDAQAKEIATLIASEEAKDAEREDLERIQALADKFVGQSIGLPARARAAVHNAHEQRTKNSLEQMRREIEQLYEEEEAALIAALLMDD